MERSTGISLEFRVVDAGTETTAKRLGGTMTACVHQGATSLRLVILYSTTVAVMAKSSTEFGFEVEHHLQHEVWAKSFCL